MENRLLRTPYSVHDMPDAKSLPDHAFDPLPLQLNIVHAGRTRIK
jgi:hypothetical protein